MRIVISMRMGKKEAQGANPTEGVHSIIGITMRNANLIIKIVCQAWGP